MAVHASKHKSKLPELHPPPSFQPQELEQPYAGHFSDSRPAYHTALVLRRRRSSYDEPCRPDDFIPPPPPGAPNHYKQIEYYPPHPDEEYLMSGALVHGGAPTSASRVACRVPDRRVATVTASEELPPGIPAQVTFVAAHHCAGCGQPRSYAYHKNNPLIPGQIAPASLCRKCEKKIQQGKPIDSIVLPIREFPASDGETKRSDRREGRRRSRSRTRIIIRHESEDRDASPPRRSRREASPESPKRTISYRHVQSRSVSRPAGRTDAQSHREKPATAPSRHQSAPRSQRDYVVEYVHSERPIDSARSEGQKTTQRLPSRPTTRHNVDASYDDYTFVGVRNGQARTDTGTAPDPAPQNVPNDLPPPPMGLQALQPQRRSPPPPATNSTNKSSKASVERQRVIYIRRSPSPRSRVRRASKSFYAPSHTATNASTVRSYKDERAEPKAETDARRSDYNRYRQYHNRPPSPPPPTSNCTIQGPNTMEYITGDSFKQNPNPAASKAYSEASIAGSRPPASKVAFTESEIMSVDGVRVREKRYVNKSIERLVLTADPARRFARSDMRRRERQEHRVPPPPDYGHTRGWQ